MSALTVPYLAGAVLLLVAGIAKLASPSSTVGAMRGAGLPSAPALVRGLALVEVIVGTTAVLVNGRLPAWGVALCYAGFAVFLTVGMLRGTADSCGCFAGDRARPTPTHVVVDCVVATVAVAVALGSTSTSLPSAVRAGQGFPVTALVVVAAALTYLVLSQLPVRGEVPERLVGLPREAA